MNRYDSRFYSLRSRHNGRFVVQVGHKTDVDGDKTNRSDTKEFATLAEAEKYLKEFFRDKKNSTQREEEEEELLEKIFKE